MTKFGDNWSSVLRHVVKSDRGPDLRVAMVKVTGDVDDLRVRRAGGGYLVVEFAHRAFDDPRHRPGVLAGAAFHGDPDQGPRGAKEWLTRNMLAGVAYKPTADQLAMTRLLDPAHPKLNNLASFRRMRRALAFLASNLGRAGAVYPGTVEDGDG